MSSGVGSDPKDSKSFLESLFQKFYINFDMRWNRDSYLSENSNDRGNAYALFLGR